MENEVKPTEWFKRCSEVFKSVFLDTLHLPSDEIGLLEALDAEAVKFDEHMANRPLALSVEDVCQSRTLFRSLKKYEGRYGRPFSLLKPLAEERFLANNEAARGSVIPRRFVGHMRTFLSRVFRDYRNHDVNPRFGPKAVFEKLSVPRRWVELYRSKDLWFNPYDVEDNLVGNAVVTTLPCRLCAVPKDWNKARLITVEPMASSFLQHYARRKMLSCLSSCGVACFEKLATPYGGDLQSRHKKLAQRGSVDGSWATLDLSDASDLVSWYQVQQVFPVDVLLDLERCRSESFVTSGGIQLPLYMYAGMGNATTFTVETVLFYAMIHAICEYHRLPPRESKVSVFGDDIMCSSVAASLAIELFPEFGWRANQNKSFWLPHQGFRESCGGHYYCGYDVTPLNYRGNYKGLEGEAAVADLIRRIYHHNQWWVLLKDPWPELTLPNLEVDLPGSLTTSVPWWPTTSAPDRWSRRYQRMEYSVPVLRNVERSTPADQLGWLQGALSGQLTGYTTHKKRRKGRQALVFSYPLPGRVERVDAWLAPPPLTRISDPVVPSEARGL